MLVILVLAALAFKTVAPKIFISMEGYLEQGNYEKAYKKAKTDDDKKAVKVENLAAVQSAYSADNLKDPSSFSLRDVYYNDYEYEGETTPHLVLYISGANSYGASVSSYWIYTYSKDENKWKYYSSVSDLSEEEYSKYDDDDELIEKVLNNTARDYIKEAMKDGYKLDKDGVKRINKMFEDDTLDDVELLDVE